MQKKSKIYLCGAMQGTEDNGQGWRNEVLGRIERDFPTLEAHSPRILGLDDLPPAERFAQARQRTPKFLDMMRTGIEEDLMYISSEADYVIAYIDESFERSAGSNAEITWAFMANIPVLAVLKPGVEMRAWASACCFRVFDSLDAALSFAYFWSVQEDTLSYGRQPA